MDTARAHQIMSIEIQLVWQAADGPYHEAIRADRQMRGPTSAMRVPTFKQSDTLDVGDPRELLRNLVPDPQELLSMMLRCDVMLAGSRAAAFFYPAATTAQSDWDFYANSRPESALRFAAYLEGCGVSWEPLPDRCQDPYHPLSVLSGTRLGQKVQLISARSDASVLETVLSFHSTVVQCAIAGFGGLALYGDLTVKGLSFE